MTDKIPTRLALMRGAVDWLYFVPSLPLPYAAASYALRKVAEDEDRSIEDRMHVYDKFVNQLLLDGFTDSIIYNAQWLCLTEQKESEARP